MQHNLWTSSFLTLLVMGANPAEGKSWDFAYFALPQEERADVQDFTVYQGTQAECVTETGTCGRAAFNVLSPALIHHDLLGLQPFLDRFSEHKAGR